MPLGVFFCAPRGDRDLSRPLPPDEDLSARSFTVDASLSSLLVSASTSDDWLGEAAAADRFAELDELDEESGAEIAL